MSAWRWELAARIAAARVVAIVRAPDADTATATADALVAAGIDVVEISLTTPDAFAAIRATARAHPAALVGAGTVLDATSARLALDAGARFLVSPAADPGVIATAHRHGALALPGVRTPTEAVRALELGADLLKLFPADDLSPAYLQALAAPLPQAPWVPTGGVNAENAAAWLAAGAVAVGVGGSLTGDLAAVPERAAALLAAVAA